MEDRPIPTRPPSRRDELIQERYVDEIARQGENRVRSFIDTFQTWIGPLTVNCTHKNHCFLELVYIQ